MSRFGRLLAWALAAVAVSQAPAALTQSVPPPPLLPGEDLVPLGSGCALVLHLGTDPAKAATSREWYRKYEWRGTCRNGLAHGDGFLVGPGYDSNVNELPARTQPNGDRTSYVYGRQIGRTEYRSLLRVYYQALDGRGASATLGDPMNPVWGVDSNGDTTITANNWIATTRSTTCVGEPRQFPGCTSDNNYKVYGMWVWRTDDGSSPTTVWCPDPRTPVGCEALWREQSAQVFAGYQAIAAEVERDTPAWRQQLIDLNAPREAQLAALETAKREAAARQQAAQAEAEAKAEAAFQATMAKGNAGQLFALADELRESGQTVKAREVLRTLVSRFPDHPLAANAAQQLSQMGSAPGGASSRPSIVGAAAPSSRPAPGAAAYRPPASGVNEASCQAEVNRLADVLNASRARTASNVVWQMETLMYVLKGMADTTDAMCPRTQAYIDASAGFRKTYNDTARTCGQTSSQGACTPRLH